MYNELPKYRELYFLLESVKKLKTYLELCSKKNKLSPNEKVDCILPTISIIYLSLLRLMEHFIDL